MSPPPTTLFGGAAIGAVLGLLLEWLTGAGQSIIGWCVAIGALAGALLPILKKKGR